MNQLFYGRKRRKMLKKYMLVLFVLALALSPFSSLGELVYAEGGTNESENTEIINQEAGHDDGSNYKNESEDSQDGKQSSDLKGDSSDSADVSTTESDPVAPNEKERTGDNESGPETPIIPAGQLNTGDSTVSKKSNENPPVNSLQDAPPNPTADEFEWEVNNDDTVTIKRYQGAGGDLVIPTQIDGKNVTIIGDNAFSNRGITSVTIPEGVKKIGSFAFFNNNITEIALPSTLEKIERNNPFALNKLASITVHDDNQIYKHIDEKGVYSSDGKKLFIGTTTGVIEDGTAEIKYYAFRGYDLTSISIPTSVEKIHDGALQQNKIENVTIPSNVTYVYQDAFNNNQLKIAIIENDSTHLSNDIFANNPDLVIMGHANSTAETYADNNGLTFMPFTTNTPIEDDNLRKAINEALGEDVDAYHPTISDLVTLTKLEANNKGISKLAGLEYAVNLTYLNLYGNDVQNLEPIKGLTKLTELNLGENRNISDKSIIGNLTNLTTLILINTQTSDISFLENLTELTSLNISQNNITNITPLENMEKLWTLYAFGNNIQDITPLESSTNMRSLNLNNNNIQDIAALRNHTSLNYLHLSVNQINDLSTIGAFKDSIGNFEAKNQQLSLPERAVVKSSTKLEILNPVIDPNGEAFDNIIPNDGTYNQSSNTISWESLDDSITERTFTFGNPNDEFSGEVTQPIKWVDVEVTMPLNTETEVVGGQLITIDDTGTQLMLPENLPAGTILKVVDVSDESFVTDADGLEVAGPVLDFIFEYPDGQNFTGHFILTMGYDNDATDVDIYYYNDGKRAWESQNGTIDALAQTITIDPEHFSVYGLFAEVSKKPVDPEDPDDPTKPGTPDPEDPTKPGTPDPKDPEFDPCDSQDPIAAGCPEDQLKDDNGDPKVTVKGDDKTTPKPGGLLPKTATEMFNYLLVGSILLVIGVGTAIYIQRRKRATK